MTKDTPSLVLASSSAARIKLLSRLGIPFQHQSPDIDETPFPDESPAKLSIRLAENKAKALQAKYSRHLLIGSDQVAVCKGRILTKPGNREAAIQQLLHQSGSLSRFYTAVALYNSRDGTLLSSQIVTKVLFRALSEQEIGCYLDRDQPYQCAGAFKAESLGITLFQKIVSTDPTALIGLPLIVTAQLLRQAGINTL